MKLKNMVSALVAFSAMALMTVGVHAATYSAGAVTADAGTTVTVPVIVTPDEGDTDGEAVNGYVMTLTYDPTLATPVAIDGATDSLYATAGTGFEDGVLVSDKITSTETGMETVAVAWAAASPVSVTEATNMASIDFAVDSASTGSIPVTVSVIQLTNDGVVIAEDDTYTVASGSIDLSKVVWGDVNLNGAVDAGDASLIARYLANYVTLTEEQLTLGDVNNNAVVDSGDASNITRYLAGYIQSFPIEDAQQ